MIFKDLLVLFLWRIMKITSCWCNVVDKNTGHNYLKIMSKYFFTFSSVLQNVVVRLDFYKKAHWFKVNTLYVIDMILDILNLNIDCFYFIRMQKLRKKHLFWSQIAKFKDNVYMMYAFLQGHSNRMI